MRVINKKTYKTRKFLLVAVGMFLVVYAVLAVYNTSLIYAVEEMEKDIVQLKKENTQLRLSQTQSSSLDQILDRSEEMLYTDRSEVSYIERPSTSPFAIVSD